MGSPFWRVWLGESVSGLGDAAFAVAFSWVVLSTTGSSTVLAATLVAGALPRGVLLRLGGAVVDQTTARTVLLVPPAPLTADGSQSALSARSARSRQG